MFLTILKFEKLKLRNQNRFGLELFNVLRFSNNFLCNNPVWKFSELLFEFKDKYDFVYSYCQIQSLKRFKNEKLKIKVSKNDCWWSCFRFSFRKLDKNAFLKDEWPKILDAFGIKTFNFVFVKDGDSLAQHFFSSFSLYCRKRNN